MYAFGSGDLFLTPTGSNLNPNPTPIKVGVMQDCSIDISSTTKQLYGKLQFPNRVARGASKISGKTKTGNFYGKLLADTYFGAAGATFTPVGSNIPVVDESSIIAATVTASHGATFVDDLGVVNGTTGAPMTKVSAAPTAGQYSVSPAGVYTFAAADVTAAFTVRLSYSYSSTTLGNQMLVVNPALGASPTFQAQFQEQDYVTGKTLLLKLYACIFTKFTIASKTEDFVIPELDFEGFADAGGNCFAFSVGD